MPTTQDDILSALRRIAMPDGHDGVTPVPALIWAHGYRGSAAGVMRNNLNIYGPNQDTLCHSGWGGSLALGDPDQGLSAAYVMNRQSNYLQGDPRARRVRQMRRLRRAERVLHGLGAIRDFLADLFELRPGPHHSRDRVYISDCDRLDAKQCGTAGIFLRVRTAREEGEIGGDGKLCESHGEGVYSPFVLMWRCRRHEGALAPSIPAMSVKWV